MTSAIKAIGKNQKLYQKQRALVAAQQELVRLRILTHLLLTKLDAGTQEQAVLVPKADLAKYPKNARFNMEYDPSSDNFRFWADFRTEEEQQPLVEAPRRILLPT